MTDADKLVDIKRRAADVRRIAKGIFDHQDRQVVLDLAAEAERLAAEKARAVKRS